MTRVGTVDRGELPGTSGGGRVGHDQQGRKLGFWCVTGVRRGARGWCALQWGGESRHSLRESFGDTADGAAWRKAGCW